MVIWMLSNRPAKVLPATERVRGGLKKVPFLIAVYFLIELIEHPKNAKKQSV